MFRQMRRNKQLMPMERTIAVLRRCSHGILACLGDDDYPYAVPLNYVFFQNKLYIHSAKSGHKVDAMTQNPKVSFAVVDEDKVVSDAYTTLFRSVLVFGQVRIAEGEEKTKALKALVEKYSGAQPEESKINVMKGCSQAYIIAIDIEHMTGKEAVEYENVMTEDNTICSQQTSEY